MPVPPLYWEAHDWFGFMGHSRRATCLGMCPPGVCRAQTRPRTAEGVLQGVQTQGAAGMERVRSAREKDMGLGGQIAECHGLYCVLQNPRVEVPTPHPRKWRYLETGLRRGQYGYTRLPGGP